MTTHTITRIEQQESRILVHHKNSDGETGIILITSKDAKELLDALYMTQTPKLLRPLRPEQKIQLATEAVNEQ